MVGGMNGGMGMGAFGLGLGDFAMGPGPGFGGTPAGAQASAAQQGAVGLGIGGRNDAFGTPTAGLGRPGGPAFGGFGFDGRSGIAGGGGQNIGWSGGGGGAGRGGTQVGEGGTSSGYSARSSIGPQHQFNARNVANAVYGDPNDPSSPAGMTGSRTVGLARGIAQDLADAQARAANPFDGTKSQNRAHGLPTTQRSNTGIKGNFGDPPAARVGRLMSNFQTPGSTHVQSSPSQTVNTAAKSDPISPSRMFPGQPATRVADVPAGQPAGGPQPGALAPSPAPASAPASSGFDPSSAEKLADAIFGYLGDPGLNQMMRGENQRNRFQRSRGGASDSGLPSRVPQGKRVASTTWGR